MSKPRWIFNLFVVWTLTGLWHGASWNFVIWGLYYGILIVLEKAIGINEKLPKVISWILTFFLVTFGWGIFMCDSLSLGETTEFLGKLFFISDKFNNPVTVSSLRLWGYIPFLVTGFFISTPIWVMAVRPKIIELKQNHGMATGIAGDLCLLVIFVLSLVFLMGGTYNPFIYFRF